MKIQIKVSRDYISFSVFDKKTSKVNLNNTNIINVENIIFEDGYIKDNIELVASFLNTIIIKNNIHKIKINDQDLCYIILDIIKEIKYINTIEFSEDKPIDYILVNKIIENVNIETIECLNMPKFIFDLLNKNKIVVNIKGEIIYLNTFMDSNDLGTYSKIYYRRSIIIDYELKDNDLMYMDLFLKTNRFLAFINLYCYSLKQLESLINLLEKNNKYDILIRIYENDIDSKEMINYIKKVKGNYLKNNKINILIMYKDKRKPNIYKRLNIKSFKLIIFIIMAIIAINIIFIYSYKQELEKNIKFYNEYPNKFLISSSQLVLEDNNYKRVDVNKVNYNDMFKELLLSNNQTKGWIKINNTKIDLPFAKATNNKYYKNHLYNKNANKYGWIYLDNENDLNDQNVILYCGSKICETLSNTLISSWYTNNLNHKILFNTLDNNNTYEIFSIYLSNKNNIKKNYGNEFDDFIKNANKDSIYDFKKIVTKTDKILTVVSDYKNQKLIIHAVKKA